MKSNLFNLTFLAIFSLFGTAVGQEHFTLDATVTGYPDSTKVIINRIGIDPRVLETEVTLFLIDNKFSFKDTLQRPSVFSIRFRPQNPIFDAESLAEYESVFFWAENKKMVLTGRKGEVEFSDISGSELQDQYEQYVNLEKERKQRIRALTSFIVAKGSRLSDKQRKETVNEMRVNQNIIDKAGLNFILSHPEFYFARRNLLVSNWANPESIDKVQLRSFYEQLSPEFKNDVYGKQLGAIIKNDKPVKELSVGNKALAFKLPDSTGKLISLSSLKGKLVLLDFWGSGCGPCRAEHAIFLELYKTYASKGFEILSVSMDSRKDLWLSAMRRDNMIWKSVLDNGFTVYDKYKVRDLPSNFLISEDGVVIGKNLRGEMLAARLKEIYEIKAAKGN